MSDDVQQAEAVPSRPADHALYQQLAAPFDVTFTDVRGGVELTYITGEQVASRLNDTLGFLSWTFRVLEHGIHAEADECWALGELTATVGDRTVTRQQFGSQKVKRSRASGIPLDIGFDLKGASTDAMKKCASLIGVGLYLSAKTPPREQTGQERGSGPRALPQAGTGEPLICEECGEELTETRFKDGTIWAAAQLAVFGRRKHSRILCMRDYRAANDAKRRAEEALQQVPF